MIYSDKLRLKPFVFFNMQLITKITQQKLGCIEKIKHSKTYKRKIYKIAQKQLKSAKEIS